MSLYAWRGGHHDGHKTCLQWNQQMPSPVGDWMLAWAAKDGSAAATLRAKESADGIWRTETWPDPYKTYASRLNIWRLRDEHSDAMCDLCKWFYDGPCRSNKMVVDVKDVHHSFGCSGDVMMSDWFVKNLWIGDDLTVAKPSDETLPEWIKVLYDHDDEPVHTWPMFCETQKSQNLTSWSLEDIRDARRRRLSSLGEPVEQCDVDALEETLEILAWAEAHLLEDLQIMCVRDF